MEKEPRSDRTNVNQGLRGNDVQILNGHALTNDTLHTGEADAELVLQQLTNAAQTTVAQMVDVVGVADVMAKTQQIADGCQHIINDDVLRNQIILGSLDVVNQLVLALALGLCIFQQLDRKSTRLNSSHL